MIGIYKITNKINQNSYIGQSSNINKRWKNHIIASNNPNDKCYNYPLYRAFRKYGIENFSFEILEECSQNELNYKEIYWIKHFSPIYNQTTGGDHCITSSKLSLEEVNEIKNILLKDVEGKISHSILAQKYQVHKDTIRDINTGRTWFDENLKYPLHYSQFDPNKPKEKHLCCDCGKEILKTSTRCNSCASKLKATLPPVSRQELKDLIRNKSFTKIGEQFNVSDNTIRKWCKKYSLPFLAKEIKQYSNEEWQLI